MCRWRRDDQQAIAASPPNTQQLRMQTDFHRHHRRLVEPLVKANHVVGEVLNKTLIEHNRAPREAVEERFRQNLQRRFDDRLSKSMAFMPAKDFGAFQTVTRTEFTLEDLLPTRRQ